MTPNDAIFRALDGRRREVAARLASAETTEPPARPTEIEAVDPEELLRVLMVRHLPKVQKKTRTAAQIESYVEHLFALETQAAGDDWRFLDAWNHAYELPASDTVGPALGRYEPAFLLRYHEILLARCERLQSEGTPARGHR